MPIHPHKKNDGFTLLEIIIALFIFAIVSVMAVTGLHSVLTTQSATQKSAARLANLQTALLFLSRDLTQTIHRPVMNASGALEGFIGTSESVTFTHAGLENPGAQLQRSTLQRTQYQYANGTLNRLTSQMLDEARLIPPDSRTLLDDISALHFDYLDHHNHFQNRWPPPDQPSAILPLAVRVTMTLNHWGTLQQLYPIAGQPIEKPNSP